MPDQVDAKPDEHEGSARFGGSAYKRSSNFTKKTTERRRRAPSARKVIGDKPHDTKLSSTRDSSLVEDESNSQRSIASNIVSSTPAKSISRSKSKDVTVNADAETKYSSSTTNQEEVDNISQTSRSTQKVRNGKYSNKTRSKSPAPELQGQKVAKESQPVQLDSPATTLSNDTNTDKLNTTPIGGFPRRSAAEMAAAEMPASVILAGDSLSKTVDEEESSLDTPTKEAVATPPKKESRQRPWKSKWNNQAAANEPGSAESSKAPDASALDSRQLEAWLTPTKEKKDAISISTPKDQEVEAKRSQDPFKKQALSRFDPKPKKNRARGLPSPLSATPKAATERKEFDTPSAASPKSLAASSSTKKKRGVAPFVTPLPSGKTKKKEQATPETVACTPSEASPGEESVLVEPSSVSANGETGGDVTSVFRRKKRKDNVVAVPFAPQLDQEDELPAGLDVSDDAVAKDEVQLEANAAESIFRSSADNDDSPHGELTKSTSNISNETEDSTKAVMTTRSPSDLSVTETEIPLPVETLVPPMREPSTFVKEKSVSRKTSPKREQRYKMGQSARAIKKKSPVIHSSASVDMSVASESSKQSRFRTRHSELYEGIMYQDSSECLAVLSMVESKRQCWFQNELDASRREWDHYKKILRGSARELSRVETLIRCSFVAFGGYAKAIEEICSDSFVNDEGELLTDKEKGKRKKQEQKGDKEAGDSSMDASSLLGPMAISFANLKEVLETQVPPMESDLTMVSELKDAFTKKATELEERGKKLGFGSVEQAEDNVGDAFGNLIQVVGWHEGNPAPESPPDSKPIQDRWLAESLYRNAANLGLLTWKEHRCDYQALYSDIIEVDDDRKTKLEKIVGSFLPKRKELMSSSQSALLSGSEILKSEKTRKKKEQDAIEIELKNIALTDPNNKGQLSEIWKQRVDEAENGHTYVPTMLGNDMWSSAYVKDRTACSLKVGKVWKVSVGIRTLDNYLHMFLADTTLLPAEDLETVTAAQITETLACPVPELSINLADFEISASVDPVEIELVRSVRSKIFRKRDDTVFLKFAKPFEAMDWMEMVQPGDVNPADTGAENAVEDIYNDTGAESSDEEIYAA